MNWRAALRWLGWVCIVSAVISFGFGMRTGILHGFFGSGREALWAALAIANDFYTLAATISIGLLALLLSGTPAPLARKIAGCSCILFSVFRVLVLCTMEARIYFSMIQIGYLTFFLSILIRDIGILSQGLALGLITIFLGRENTFRWEPAHASR